MLSRSPRPNALQFGKPDVQPRSVLLAGLKSGPSQSNLRRQVTSAAAARLFWGPKVCKLNNQTVETNVFDPGAHPSLHVVLVHPEIPQNTGNIARTCVAIGAKLWLVRPLGFKLDQRHLRRAGLDYWEHLHWHVVSDWSELRAHLTSARFWYFSRHAQRSYADVSYARGDALVFGSETHGLPRSVCRPDECHTLSIPIPGPVRSLNLSNAVAVASFEALRQWR